MAPLRFFFAKRGQGIWETREQEDLLQLSYRLFFQDRPPPHFRLHLFSDATRKRRSFEAHVESEAPAGVRTQGRAESGRAPNR